MGSNLKILAFLLLINRFSYAQTDETTASDNTAPKEAPKEFIFKPTIGLGVGMFSFYGDMYAKHFQSPTVSRIAYDLNVSQRLTDYFQLNFYVLSGKLGANERNYKNNRNLNFESQINVGGLKFEYNFGHFLPMDRTASPFISLGIESFEFLSKTDLYDKNGNRYYYWSDGKIRDMDEGDPNATNAVVLNRDYEYETDIREMNLDGFGKYAERSWAIPVGAGVMFQINDYWDFKIGASMHFTFTDYIDGITKKSLDNRAGTPGNDKFMMSSFSLHYNLGLKKNDPTIEEEVYEGVDFLALDNEDQDKDGVSDLTDSCQGTPEGVPVDAKGCPLDDDADGVPNYKDDEINSPAGSYVDLKGVQMSDSLIAYQYNFYMDSTGAFAKVEVHDHNGKSLYKTLYEKEYTVRLGVFEKGLAPEVMTKFLSINDISNINIDDSTTMYTAGAFTNSLDAEKRKQQLVSEGLTDAKVIYKQNGKFYDAPAYTANSGNTTPVKPETTTDVTNNNQKTKTTTDSNPVTDNQETKTNTDSNPIVHNKQKNVITNKTSTSNEPLNNVSDTKGIVLRVQLGAYQRRLSKNVFKNVPDLIEVKTEDGLYKYMSGSFTNFDAAAKHKVNLLLKGYQGAFIAAYKDGKRIPLGQAGATLQKKEDRKEGTDSSTVNAVDKKLIIFKIQVGAFKNAPPAEKQAIYDKIGATKETTPSGANRYVIGSFSDYKAAQAFKADLVKKGVEDGFIVAFFNGEYISIQEALELLK